MKKIWMVPFVQPHNLTYV